MTQITFLGAGNIAYAIASGLLANGHPADTLTAADPTASQLDRFAALGMRTLDDNRAAIVGADVVLLTVKPDIVSRVARELGTPPPGTLFVSVAAGITLTALGEWLGEHVGIVRCMPNTPALKRVGITGAMPNAAVSEAQKALAATVLGAVGDLVWVDAERLLDAVTAVSGSGPAYFFLMMEYMQKTAESLGLPPALARQLVVKTALGAATMVDDGATDPGAQRAAVTSPGGTTAAAIDRFVAGGFEAMVDSALHAAFARSIELSGE